MLNVLDDTVESQNAALACKRYAKWSDAKPDLEADEASLKAQIKKTKTQVEALFLKTNALKSEIAKTERQMRGLYNEVPDSRDVLINLDSTMTKLQDQLEAERRKSKHLAEKPKPYAGTTLFELCEAVR